MSEDKIVRMANQIATFFHSKPHAEGVAGIADHINKYWEKRMRAQFFDQMKQDETAFDPWVREAASLINRPS